MCAKSVIVLILIQILIKQNLAFILKDSNCKAICSVSNDKAEFDKKTKACKCLLKKNLNDTDIGLINKTAEKLGKQLNKVVLPDQQAIISKRDVNKSELQEVTQTAIPLTKEFSNGTIVIREETNDNITINNTSEATNTGETENSNETETAEEVVGQTRRRLHHRLVAQRRHQLRPITAEQQRHIMQQMRDHLARLSQTTDSRARQTAIDAVRSHLRQLSQTTVMSTPTQRSRSRNIVEEARRRQHRQRLLHNSRIVGAPQNNEDEALNKNVHDIPGNDVESALKEIFHHKTPHSDIIIQDPTLIDE